MEPPSKFTLTVCLIARPLAPALLPPIPAPFTSAVVRAPTALMACSVTYAFIIAHSRQPNSLAEPDSSAIGRFPKGRVPALPIHQASLTPRLSPAAPHGPATVLAITMHCSRTAPAASLPPTYRSIHLPSAP